MMAGFHDPGRKISALTTLAGPHGSRADDGRGGACAVGRATAGAGSQLFTVFNAETSGVSHLRVRPKRGEMPVKQIGNICRHGKGPRQEDAVTWFASSG